MREFVAQSEPAADSRTSRGEENAIVVAMTLYVAIYTIEIDFVDRDPQVSSKQKGIVWRSTSAQNWRVAGG